MKEKKELKEDEVKTFTFDPVKEDKASVPTREKVINEFFKLAGEHHYNWQYINLFYVELFHRVFGVPLYYRERYVSHKDGEMDITDGEVYTDTFHMEMDMFQRLYDRSIACIMADYTGMYLFFFNETIISVKVVAGGKYMVVTGIISNLEPFQIREILDGAKKYDIKVDKNKFYIAISSKTQGIYTKQHELKKMDIDVSKCYNDTLPYGRIKEILTNDGKSLILFYGEPGTGKTTLIKKLISEVERKFIFMDASVVTNISDDSFVDFLSENTGSIIVLEDCEKILVSRDQAYNQTIGTVLNLTDGVIGDSFEVKFICTFNSDLDSVDKAVLRKGRLSLKYEFGKLTLDKTRAIYPDAEEEMTVADAFNALDKNDYAEENSKKKIGF